MKQSFDWTPLEQELRLWEQAGLRLPLWWRDDDAVTSTAALDQLAQMSTRLGLPVHLAIIPAHADPAWSRDLPDCFIPVVHGWAHQSHSQPDQKKSEFPASRPLAERVADAQSGLNQLKAQFGARLLPMFVPPWNRVGADLLPELPALGYRAISTYQPRHTAQAAPGLAQINTHLDPIEWRGHRSLCDPDTLIQRAAANLTARRLEQSDAQEPFGILTHHLVHDAAIWQFSEALITRLLDGPATVWQFEHPAPPPFRNLSTHS